MAFRTPKPLDIEGLMNYAARALSARAYTVSELKTRLKKRAARAEDIEQVLSRLKQAGVVNDRRFAGSFAEWRRESQGMGKTRVLRDLMARRVAPAVAKEAVDAAFEGVSEEKQARDFLRRKRLVKPKDQKQAARIFRQLARGGFGTKTIFTILKKWEVDEETLSELESETA
jgi:regulatory protein